MTVCLQNVHSSLQLSSHLFQCCCQGPRDKDLKFKDEDEDKEEDFNPFKPNDAKWLHFRAFMAILV